MHDHAVRLCPERAPCQPLAHHRDFNVVRRPQPTGVAASNRHLSMFSLSLHLSCKQGCSKVFNKRPDFKQKWVRAADKGGEMRRLKHVRPVSFIKQPDRSYHGLNNERCLRHLEVSVKRTVTRGRPPAARKSYSRCARFRRGSGDSTDAVLNSPEAASTANRLSMA